MKRKLLKIPLLAVWILAMSIGTLHAQKNIAPLATITATGTGAGGCQSGACSLLNDLNLGTCGTQQVWISTATPPSSTIGADYIQWDFPSPKRFNKLVIHHASNLDPRFLAGALIQYWNGTAWVSHYAFSNLPLNCSNTVTFNAISASRFRITQFVMKGPGQLSNPNFREIEIIESPGGMNNAGVQNVTPGTFCAGTQSLSTLVENGGRNKLDSLRVNWSVDGVRQSTIYYKTAIDTAGSASGNTKTISLGSVSFATGVVKTIKVWTSDPNGKKDTMPTNDTLVVKLSPAISGTYTINPSGSGSTNFKTFTEAVNSMTSYGICGPVTFNVSAGTYKERIVIPAIIGSSSTNTITFDGSGATSMPVLQNAATALTDQNSITLDGADYVTIKGFKIENTGTTYGTGILLLNGADYNKILNNTIVTPSSSSAYHIGILASASTTSYSTYGNTANNNEIKGNHISGGYYGIRFNGSSTSSLITGNQFINNVIDDYYYYGMYLYYNGGQSIIGNTLRSRTTGTTTTASYGIMNYYAADYTIQNNDIVTNGYGLYLYYGDYYLQSKNTNVVANNLVKTTNYYPLYSYYSSNINMYHNTFATTSGAYGAYIYYASTYDMRNNILVNEGSGVALYLGTGNTFKNLDYNLYYAPNAGSIINNNGSTYKSVADWKKANTVYDQNSYQVDPGFKSATDLHLTTTTGKPFGRYVGIDKDIDGDVRCKMAPTVGADESSVGKTSKPVAGFSGNDTVFVGSPATYFNTASANDPYFYKYYVDGKYVTDSIHLKVVAASTGTIQIKLVVEGCAGNDSITKTIRVINPTSKPAVRFIADKSAIVQGDVVRFTDLSRNGAVSWQWDITPDSTFDGATKIARYKFLYNTDATSQNPVVQFISSGKYKVCLTATNGKGSSSLCRTDYILVTSAISLTSGTQTTLDSAGYIYDNGGKDGSYASSFKGGIVIAPCAEEIYLVFKKFDTECGYDYVRVFDGTDNKGKPLHRCTTNTSGTNGPGFVGGPSSNTCATYCFPSSTDTLVAKSGKMYLEMQTDASGVYSGFEAYYWSKPKAQPKPTASFTSADSVCVNKANTFTNTSTGDDITYYWDLDNDLSTFELTTKNATWPYYVTGNYTITLIAQNCGGSDTFTKEIVVYSPPTPNVAFSADNTNPTINDIVFFNSDIKECVDDYRWSFSSATGKSSVTYVNGTTFRSENPQVMFSEKGCYSVQLFAANSTGEDSLRLSCYINVKDAYCAPTVANNVTDLGISKVTINTISNTSTQGVNDYENFIASKSTTLELGVTYKLTVERTSNQNEITRNVWIDWNADGDFNDAGENVAQEVNKLTRSWSVDIKVPTTAKTAATIMRIAVNDGSYTNKVCGQNEYGEYEDYRIYVRPDLTLPVITLLGQDTVVVEQGFGYKDAGATAMDNLDGDITSKIVKDSSKFDYLIPGTYIFSYNVVDASGNSAVTVKRVVIVTPDQTAPELVVTKPDTINLQVGKAFTVPAVIRAEDLVDGDLSGAVTISNTVNSNVVGSYTVTYTVSDVSGNTATVVRYVNVIDTVMPTITLVGGNPALHEVGSTYTDSGVVVKDNYYSESDLRKNLVVQSNVNPNVVGTYAVVYVLTDPFTGKSVSITRTVLVRDTKAPVITLVGDTAITLEVFDVLNDPGVNVTDNYDKNLAVTKGGTFYQQFPTGKATALGRYIVTYTVTDNSGNTTSISRSIWVVDTQAPVVTLSGDPNVNVCRWSTYTDAGYTMKDNYYQSNDITVTQEGNFTTSGTDVEGLYNLRYKAVDKSGNVGYSEWRQINVRSPYEFPCSTATSVGEQIGLDKLVNVYPNPNQGKFTVEANIAATEQVRITVTNILGQEIAVISNGALNTHTFSVDLSNQKAGVYMLNVTTSKQSVTKRIVVTK